MRKSTLYWYLNNLRIGQIICVKLYSIDSSATHIFIVISLTGYLKRKETQPLLHNYHVSFSSTSFLHDEFAMLIWFLFFFPVSTSDSLEHVKSLILPMQKPCARSCMRHSHYKMRTKVSLVMCIISNRLPFSSFKHRSTIGIL